MESTEHERIQVRAYYLWEQRIEETAAGDDVSGDALSDWVEAEKEQKEIECEPTASVVSFERDILPMFRQIDIDHMLSRGVLLADYAWMADATGENGNAKAVFTTLEKQSMPPHGPFWKQDQLDLYAKWMADGFVK